MAVRRGGGEVGFGLGRRREEVDEGGRGGRRGCNGLGGGGRWAFMRAWAAVRDEGEGGGSMSEREGWLAWLRRTKEKDWGIWGGEGGGRGVWL